MSHNYCHGKLVSQGTYAYLPTTDPSWQFRARSFQPGVGTTTTFNAGFHNLGMYIPFADKAGQWAGYLNHIFYYYNPYHAGALYFDWLGEVGTVACHRYSWAHNRGRGLDLAQIRWTNGYWMDSNYSHSSNLLHQRRYLATVASLRRYFRTVLTKWFNSDHRDHIHFDDRYSATYITSRRGDTVIIQSACNLLNGAGIAVDGSWGPNTWTAYNNLLAALGMSCYNPRGSSNDTHLLMYYITLHSVANKNAGHWKAGC